jgi:hypothetical protein
MIVNSIDSDTQIQVRGRVNSDLERLYLPMTAKTIVVPKEFLDVRLFKENTNRLCQYLNLRNRENNRPLKWPSIKSLLPQSGYKITDGREDNYRYYVIHKSEPES